MPPRLGRLPTGPAARTWYRSAVNNHRRAERRPPAPLRRRSGGWNTACSPTRNRARSLAPGHEAGAQAQAVTESIPAPAPAGIVSVPVAVDPAGVIPGIRRIVPAPVAGTSV